MNEAKASAASHWISRDTYIGLTQSEQPIHEYSVFVVFDEGTEQAFSTIRLIFLCKNNTEMMMRERHQEVEVEVFGPTSVRYYPYYRTSARLKHTLGRYAALVSESSSLELYFEVVSDPQMFYRCDFELREPKSLKSEAFSSGYRIIFDRTLMTSSSKVARLSMEVVRNDRYFAHESGYYCSRHVIRILPTKDRRKPILVQRIPKNILRTIVRLTVNIYSKSWRKDLLDLSLIQKSWSHLQDVFFEFLGTTPIDHLGDIGAVCRFIDRHPYCGSRITDYNESLLSLNHAPWHENEEKVLTVTKPVLRHARANLKRLLLYKTSFVLHKDLFSQLEAVETLKLASYSSEIGRDDVGWGNSPNYSVQDAVIITRYWPKLRSLTIEPWANWMPQSNSLHPCETVKSALSLSENPASHNDICFPSLRQLEFLFGDFTGSSLSWFIGARLSSLRLLAIRNLNNSELFSFLSSQRETLERLEVARCVIAIDDGEFPAVERVLPGMSSLQSLTLTGDAFTENLLVARRGEGNSHGADTNLPSGKIELHYISKEFMVPLPKALETCDWKNVHLRFVEDRDGIPSLQKQAVEVAKRRGIDLKMWVE